MQRERLQPNGTAVVFPSSLDDVWVFVIALRTLGLNTICVQSPEQARELGLRDVSCVVLSDVNQQMSPLSNSSVSGALKIVVPSHVFSSIHTGDVPLYPQPAPPLGGHVLLTSGTTGYSGKHEDGRNAARANVYPLNRNMIYHVGNLAVWSAVGFGLPSAVCYTGGCVVMDTTGDAVKNFFRYRLDLSIVTPVALKELVRAHQYEPSHDECELLVTSGFLPIERFVS